MSSLLQPASRSAPRFNPALHLACASLFATLFFAVPAHAAAIDESIPSADALAQLELRASQAKPREQCFLYTELAHTMTEKAGMEIANGETEQAANTLKKVNQYAHLIHMNLAKDAKGLKDAEILMHHTTYRLAQYMHLVSGPDKDNVQDTLKQLNQINDELLSQVFDR